MAGRPARRVVQQKRGGGSVCCLTDGARVEAAVACQIAKCVMEGCRLSGCQGCGGRLPPKVGKPKLEANRQGDGLGPCWRCYPCPAAVQIFEKNPTTVKNYGIWVRYQSRTGYHNAYKEYRDTTLNGAVSQLYQVSTCCCRVGWWRGAVSPTRSMADSCSATGLLV